MTRRQMMAGFGLAVGALLIGLLGFWIGRQPAAITPSTDRAVLYWYDPMVPDTHFDKPGKSPFMDMDLVPRYAGQTDPEAGIEVSPAVRQNLGIRLARVEKTSAASEIRASGTLTYNDRSLATVQTKVDGFVERSYGRAVGDVVLAGDALVEIRAPAWSGALAEYLALRSGSDAALADAARRRLGALGVPDEALAVADRRGVAPSVFTVRSPVSGAILSLDARPGAALPAGSSIATISGVSPVWLIVSVPQASTGSLKTGVSAQVRFPAFPAEAYTGRIDAILPGANLANRTVELRVALDNRDGRLRPGMTGDVTLTDGAADTVLTVPSEAVIRTGRRTLVIVARDDGAFEPMEISTGAELGDRLEVTSGLSEGQSVVASGQFLIDSEANLSGVLERLRGGSNTPSIFASTGKVTAIDAAGVTIAHAPIPELSWPEMTMSFSWGTTQRDVAVGDAVSFSFHKSGTGYELTSIRKAGDTR